MIDELQGKRIRIEASDGSPLAHAKVSFSNGTRGEAAHIPLLAVTRCLGDSLPDARELLSPGVLNPSKNDPADRDNSRADKSSDNEDDIH